MVCEVVPDGFTHVMAVEAPTPAGRSFAPAFSPDFPRDFALPPLGPIDPHILLVLAWVWMGVHLLRLPDAVWRGAPPVPA